MNRTVLAQLAELPGMPTHELKELWRRLMTTPPPQYNRAYLEKRLAYRIQELADGGLSTLHKVRMDSILKDEGFDALAKVARKGRAKKIQVAPGTLLRREWQGRIYEVKAVEDGFMYNAGHYKSLSRIAKIITGTQWSGPSFFDLKPKNTRRSK